MNKTIFEEEINPIFNFLTIPEQPVTAVEKTYSSPTNAPDTTITSSENKSKKKTGGRKTKRLNLLIQPVLHEKMAKIACIKQTSVNAVIVAAAKEYCAKEARALEKYERTFGDGAEEAEEV